MTGYGSIDNPVPLDPFTWVTEVHWTGTFLMVSFGMKMTSTPQGERGIGPGSPFVDPFTEAFVTEAMPEYNPSQPSVKVSKGSGFENVPSSEVSLTGMPDAPAASTWDAWKVQGINVPVNGLYSPFIRWIAPSGSPPDVKWPGARSFVATKIAHGEVVAQEIISEPLPAPFAGDVPLWATFNPTLAQQSTFSLDMAGLSATYKDRTYLPIGIKVTDQLEFNTGTLSVLLKKQPAT